MDDELACAGREGVLIIVAGEEGGDCVWGEEEGENDWGSWELHDVCWSSVMVDMQVLK